MKHVVGFSGGIDSQACCGWVLDHFPKEDVIVINSQAGRNEHPLTAEHVEWYSDNVHPVIEVVPIIADLGNRGIKPSRTADRRREYDDSDEMTFADLAYIKGRFPSKKAQFCTEMLKLAPQRRWMRENLVDEHGIAIEFCRYAGVRRDESQSRASTPDEKWDDYFDCMIYYPIASWSKQQCFDFCLARGEEINQLYKMGFSRVGCAPCVNSSKGDIREWAARAPEMINKVRMWEGQVGRTFFPPINGNIWFVDDVVKWSRTVHGGKQMSLPFVEDDAQNEVCSSKYGLCE